VDSICRFDYTGSLPGTLELRGVHGTRQHLSGVTDLSSRTIAEGEQSSSGLRRARHQECFIFQTLLFRM